MHQRILAVAALAGLLILVGGCATPSSAKPIATPTAAAPATTKTIVVGLIYPEEPAKRIKQWLPFADRVAAGLGQFGIGSGDVKIAPDKDAMAQWLADEQVDLYVDSPSDAVTVLDKSGAQPLMRRWKGGKGEYSSVIFAKSSSGLKSLADLKGRALAFQDPGSTSGYLLPTAHLLKSGLKVSKQENRSPGADEVGYLFTGRDDKTIQGVISGEYVAGAIDDTRFNGLPEDVRGSMVVLAQTETVPRGVAVARRGMDPQLLGTLKTLLQRMHETPGGQELLDSLDANRFDEFPGGTDAAVARIRTMQQLLQNR